MLDKEVVIMIARYIMGAFVCGSLLTVIIVGLVFQPTLYKVDPLEEPGNNKQACELTESEEPVGYLKCPSGFTCYYLVTYYGPVEEVDDDLFMQASFSADVVVAGEVDPVPIFYGAEVELLSVEKFGNSRPLMDVF